MNKITLGVLFGGVSSEHDISTVSAKGILSAIDKEKYNLVLLGITKEGRWFLFDDDIDLLPEDRWLTSPSLVPAWISPDRSVHGVVTAKGDTIRLDAVFPVLHGKNGEDGTVQGLLQLAGIPFVGCDATASGVCMDKAVTNAVADAVGIAPGQVVRLHPLCLRQRPRGLPASGGGEAGLSDFCKACQRRFLCGHYQGYGSGEPGAWYGSGLC